MSHPSRYPALLLFLLATAAAGVIGSMATFPNVATWYPTLQRPPWTPPNWLFGPVWTTLYAMMAVAGWRVWRACQDGAAARGVLRLYGAQLALNALWSVCFFGLRRPDFGLVDIAGLWILLVIALVRFWRADRLAGLLWAPYVLWVSYASALNFELWRLNR